MKLRTPYWILVIFLHTVILVLSYFLLEDQYVWFVGVQVLAAISIGFAYKIYRNFQYPLDMAQGGRGALQDRDFSIKYLPTGVHEIDSLVETYNGMIESLRAERIVLQEQQYLLIKLIEASPSGILLLDHDGNISDANPRVCKILGFDPLNIEMTSEMMVHPILLAAQHLKAGASKQIILNSTTHYRIEVGDFIDRGFKRKFVQIQSLTQEILAAEKRAYGKVIRMMAHEVNNSIGAVNALLQTFSDPDAFPDEEWIQDVRQSLPIAIERNQRLNIFMKNFAEVVRLPDPHFERVDLVKLIQQSLILFHNSATNQQTKLHQQLPQKPYIRKIDTTQIEQVIVNVLKNALEALKKGGEINVILDGEKNCLIIANNGKGISPENVEKIFTPFFTTKSHGQGIGLTLVQEILNNHGFQFSLKTDVDGWTRFQILF